MSGFKRVVTVAVVVIVASAAALAQTTTGFEPATNLGKESLPAGPLVYTAYAIVWLVLIGYVFMLWRRLDRVEKELREVAARIGSAKGSSADARNALHFHPAVLLVGIVIGWILGSRAARGRLRGRAAAA
jgi:CcmD family protein